MFRKFLNRVLPSQTHSKKTNETPKPSESAHQAQDKEFKFLVEPLEQRILLSGNVFATILGGDLLVSGDQLDNDLDLEVVENDLVLVGNNGTTINGSSEIFIVSEGSPELSGSVVAHLKQGNDRFAVGPGVQIADSFVVVSGKGDDSVGLDSATVSGKMRVIGAQGKDTIAIRNSQIHHVIIHTGIGDDVVSVVDSEISGQLKSTLASGDDNVHIEKTTVKSRSVVFSGAGDDNFIVQDSTFEGALKQVAGSGDDFTNLQSTTINGRTVLIMASGDDSTLIDGTNQLAKTAVIVSGTGDDNVEIDSASDLSSKLVNVGAESESVPQSTTDARLNDPSVGALTKSAEAQMVFRDPVAEPATLSLDLSQNQLTQANGTQITNNADFVIRGTTNPGATITVARDSDGVFDDGNIVADASGDFEVTVTLLNNDVNLGVNDLVVRTTNLSDQTAEEVVALHFAVGSVIRYATTLGDFEVELLDTDAPTTVSNFKGYLDRYEDLVVQRSPGTSFVIQAGGFTVDENDNISSVPTDPSITGEFDPANSNVRGTLSMALQSDSVGQSLPDSGTSQWFINTSNNTSLDSRGHTVFGRVIGNGMGVVDAIDQTLDANVSSTTNGAFEEIPLRDYTPFTIPITGTLSIAADSKTVIGIGTQFTSELVPGEGIGINGERFTVDSIVSDTELTVELPSSNPAGIIDGTGGKNMAPVSENYIFLDITELGI